MIGSVERGRLLTKDLELFHRVAGTHSPFLDAVLPRLSRSADHGLLWLAVAGGLGLTRGRRRRAAVRGLLAAAVASPVANIPAKLSFRRSRPPLDQVVLARRLRQQPSTLSFPSGHSASAAAFAVGVALETPKAGAAVGIVAAGVAYSRVYTGVHYPGDVLGGILVGAGCALLTTRTWPRRPSRPAKGHTVSHATPALHDGLGLTVVVNRSSGKASKGTLADDIRQALPAADVRECEPEDVAAALRTAAAGARALGVVGGDGTVNSAARIAVDADLPLAVFPGGTLDHFAQDIGIDGADETTAAVGAGTAAAVEIGWVDGCDTEIFLNTASLGGYPEIVATRERLEEYLGKWPSVLIALVRVIRRGEPLDLVVDGEHRKLWLLFAGNGHYSPSGFAPTFRADLTDGLLDIRMVDAEAPLARTRLLAAVLSGRLGRSRVYEQRLASHLELRRSDGTDDLVMALDGEVSQALPELRLTKHPKRLLVYRPED
ncbi:MAG TPA: phosphatase PAP2 family protein [Frankiaceae bacterium]|nr:phosphatase PAP2 family protein [Frankiaceae bacterium]